MCAACVDAHGAHHGNAGRLLASHLLGHEPGGVATRRTQTTLERTTAAARPHAWLGLGGATDRIVDPVQRRQSRCRPRRLVSLLIQPFLQYQEVVQPLAMVSDAVAVLTHDGANAGGAEPAAIAQRLTVRQLV